MTELEVLQEISNKLSFLTDIKSGLESIVIIQGVEIALILVVLFALAWGKNA